MFSCSKADDTIYFDETAEVNTVETTSYTALESEILVLVNTHRVSIGLKELNSLPAVSNIAKGHTNYMIESGKISHDNFDQRAKTLMDKEHAISVGENVAYGYSTAESVLKGWLNSDTHRAVIENPDFTHFGISTITNSEGRNFFTQLFIKK